MIAVWFKRAAVLSLAGVMCACGVNPSGANADLGTKFRQTIPGRWRCEIHKEDLYSYMEKTYYPDGSAEGFVTLTKRRLGVSFQLPQVRFKSRWRVNGGIVECYDIRSVPGGMFEPGEVIQDQLVSVKPNRIETRAVRTGDREVLERISSR